jgi:hypothetical protein
MYKIRFTPQNYSKSIKLNQNLSPFKGARGIGVAAGRGVLSRLRMHVLCPQIHKNCEYQGKFLAKNGNIERQKHCSSTK